MSSRWAAQGEVVNGTMVVTTVEGMDSRWKNYPIAKMKV
jgi:hypothetical protein